MDISQYSVYFGSSLKEMWIQHLYLLSVRIQLTHQNFWLPGLWRQMLYFKFVADRQRPTSSQEEDGEGCLLCLVQFLLPVSASLSHSLFESTEWGTERGLAW